MTTRVSHAFLNAMASGGIDVDSDTFLVILMNTGFVWNRATQTKYADISAYELATGNGYTQKTKALSGLSHAKDDTLYKDVISWSNPQWTASGGAIGPSPGAFIIDDTHADDLLVQYIDFGGDGTEPDGGTFTIANPKLELTT